jgi:hypothetical protein
MHANQYDKDLNDSITGHLRPEGFETSHRHAISPVESTPLGYLDDTALEQDVLAKKLTAPRVTKDQVDALVASLTVQTHHFEGTRLTIACTFLPDGTYIGYGESLSADPANFNLEVGIQRATQKALEASRTKLWELEGYRLWATLMQGYVEKVDQGPNIRFEVDPADPDPAQTLTQVQKAVDALAGGKLVLAVKLDPLDPDPAETIKLIIQETERLARRAYLPPDGSSQAQTLTDYVQELDKALAQITPDFAESIGNGVDLENVKGLLKAQLIRKWLDKNRPPYSPEEGQLADALL